MTDEEMVEKLKSEPDFIFGPKYRNSVQELLRRYPNGVPDKIIAQVLGISIPEVEEAFQLVILKIRSELKLETT